MAPAEQEIMTESRKTLSIIGCGKVGKTLARLWAQTQTFVIQDVLNRSQESSERAVSFIGGGRAIGDYTQLRLADVYMIAAGDDQIAECCEKLASTGQLSSRNTVFHCSGALPSNVLQPAAIQGATIASIHPIRSFASPEQVAASFAETWCGAEGDHQAIELLSKGFSALGAQLVPIAVEFKTVYHSAAVFACNYLVTLLDTARQAYVQAGIPPDAALQLMEPLVRETIDNVFHLGPEAALTGPIARGDTVTVVRQYRAVSQWNKRYGGLYKQLGKLTAGLAARKNRQ